MISQFSSQNHGDLQEQRSSFKICLCFFNFFLKITATLHLEAKILSQKKPKSQIKFLMPQKHRFAAHQCTCCGTLVCRGTAVGKHWYILCIYSIYISQSYPIGRLSIILRLKIEQSSL